MKEQILSKLPESYPWKDQFQYFTQISSTNDVLKAMARQGAPHGTVLIADHQTGGHGRLGRSFHSPEGVGVYLSLLIRPNCSPGELMHLTCAAGIAMCDAVEQTAYFRPGIKWTNDLVFGRRKLGGILTELGLSPKGLVDYAIIGIGINCCQKPEDFPSEIRDIAASLSIVSGEHTDRATLAAAMMVSLQKLDSILLTRKDALLEQYRRDCITIGQEISLVREEEIRHGTALNVDDAGALVVRFSDGHTEAVNSGEVSVRGMYGYV